MRTLYVLTIVDEDAGSFLSYGRLTAEQALAAQDLDAGAENLGRLIRYVPLDRLPPRLASVLVACGCQLEQSGAERKEYVLLTLTILHESLTAARRKADGGRQ